MAVTWTEARRNAIADREAAVTEYVSVHASNPGSTGDDEASGGSPAYARQAISFEPAGDVGPLGASVQPATAGVAWAAPTFDLPAGTWTHYGYWSASTAGTFYGGGALSTTVTLGADGTQQVSIAIGPNA